MPENEPALANETRVLVAFLPRPRDLEIAQQRGWYRIRSRDAADRVPGGIRSYAYLAFYQPQSFGPEKFCIRRYARILRVSEVPRVVLFPDQPNHPRARELYYRLDLGPVRLLDRAVVSDRPRRLLFIPTTWAKLSLSREINDLFVGSRLEDLLYRRLRELGLQPEREYYVGYPDPAHPRRERRHYFLDLALFCRDRQVDIETDGDTWHANAEGAARDNARDNLLETNLWHVLRFSTRQIEEGMDRTLSVIREAVNRYGGVKDPNDVVRRFAPDGRLLPGQGELDLWGEGEG